jgi:regulator of protease activity HflC (stomatin/prohibitin superfamily)
MGCTALLVIGAACALYFLSFGIHKIDEGYVGVYYRGGKLLNSVTGPGYNVRNPYLTTYEQV